MATLANDTIGGYNSFLDEQIKNEIEANISVLFFDTGHSWWQSDVPLKKAKKLDKDSYVPAGGTALNDAIARAAHVLEFKNPKKAVVVIVTDGEENSSKETQPAAVKEMLAKMQAKDYRIIYLAANQDAFKTAANYGINLSGVANIRNDGIGTRSAYAAASGQTMNYLSNGMKGLVGNAQSLVDSFIATAK
jgi:hypothetical protein